MASKKALNDWNVQQGRAADKLMFEVALHRYKKCNDRDELNKMFPPECIEAIIEYNEDKAKEKEDRLDRGSFEHYCVSVNPVESTGFDRFQAIIQKFLAKKHNNTNIMLGAKWVFEWREHNIPDGIKGLHMHMYLHSIDMPLSKVKQKAVEAFSSICGNPYSRTIKVKACNNYSGWQQYLAGEKVDEKKEKVEGDIKVREHFNIKPFYTTGDMVADIQDIGFSEHDLEDAKANGIILVDKKGEEDRTIEYETEDGKAAKFVSLVEPENECEAELWADIHRTLKYAKSGKIDSLTSFANFVDFLPDYLLNFGYVMEDSPPASGTNLTYELIHKNITISAPETTKHNMEAKLKAYKHYESMLKTVFGDNMIDRVKAEMASHPTSI